MIEILFMLTTVMTVILGFLIILIFLKTPALTLLAASMGGKSILANFRKDRSLQLLPVKYEAGMATTKRLGFFLVTPNSNYREKKSGVNFMAVNSDTGVGLPLEYFQMANKMKQEGIDDYDIADYINTKIIEEYNKAKEEAEKNPENKEAEKLADGLKFKCPTFITIGFDAIKDFFYYNLNASSIQYLLEKKMAAELQKHREGNLKWIPYIAVLLVCAAIAIFIMYGVFNQPANGVSSSIDINALANALRSSTPAPTGG